MALNSSNIFYFLFFFLFTAVKAALSVTSTILVIADDAGVANSTSSGLKGYGIPYQTAVITSSTQALPALNRSATSGNFGAILVYDDSTLSTSQYSTIYAYQTAFKVRLVILNASPGSQYGKNIPQR
jgi:CheY-like chemotaxis protein